MDHTPLQPLPAYLRIYEVVKTIPAGRVATYGQVASIVGNCTARMVGYALAVVPPGSDVPWQRVINAQGKISLRADSAGHELQRQLLIAEGVHFDAQGKIALRRFRWAGPQLDWLLEQGYDPEPAWRDQ